MRIGYFTPSALVPTVVLNVEPSVELVPSIADMCPWISPTNACDALRPPDTSTSQAGSWSIVGMISPKI